MENSSSVKPRFPLGATLVTAGVNELILAGKLNPRTLLQRHQSGDWGDLETSDKQANENALLGGGRLFSVYEQEGGLRFWVITEADRSSTTILLPEEY